MSTTDTPTLNSGALRRIGEPAPEPTEDVRAGPRNVIEAIACIMRELPGIGKDSKASEQQGGYAYRGIEAITAHLQRLMGRHGVVFVLRELEHRIVDLTVNGKPWTDTILTVAYEVYGPGGVGDHITVGPITAVGRDNSDKGANKARTQALKYALLQTFCIGDAQADADSGSPASDRSSAAERAEAEQDVKAQSRGWQDGRDMNEAHRALIAEFRAGGKVHAALGLERAREVWQTCPVRPMSRDDFDGFLDAVNEVVRASVPAEEPVEAPEASQAPEVPPEPSEASSDPPQAPASTVDAKPSNEEMAEHARRIAAQVRELTADAEPMLVEATAATVKGLHHAVVDRTLRERFGYEVTGEHIDSRRMLLTAAMISAASNPGVCERLDCSEAVEDDGEVTCRNHRA